jgi:pilus assembly protein FimV
MNSVRNFVKGVGAAALLLAGLAATQAGAVGIGKARVESFLGEPLRVRVTLSFVPGENITNACVRIASPPGVESPFIPDLARARFQMIEGPSGAELLITTSRPYTDPILVFPLKVGCGEGGVYREITLLIDPPGMAAPTRAARAAPKPSTRCQGWRVVRRSR